MAGTIGFLIVWTILLGFIYFIEYSSLSDIIGPSPSDPITGYSPNTFANFKEVSFSNFEYEPLGDGANIFLQMARIIVNGFVFIANVISGLIDTGTNVSIFFGFIFTLKSDYQIINWVLLAPLLAVGTYVIICLGRGVTPV